MKRICFPCTNRVHYARQNLLLNELRKYFEVDIFEPTTKGGKRSVFAIFCAIEFNNFLAGKNYDAVLIRGDRYEVLGLAMVSAYQEIPIIHLEGGDLSSVIDNRVRHAVTHLSDYHFSTNEESHSRLIGMGIHTDRVWNFGSLDVEFATKVKPKRLREKPYLLVAYHPIDGENENEITEALKRFNLDIVNVSGNKDYGRGYGEEEFSPEDYVNLMRYASCCIGNSSSLLKEASVLNVNVVNIGSRQNKRLKPQNVLDVPCEAKAIELGIKYQLQNPPKTDTIYYKDNTSQEIALKIKEFI